MSSINNSLIAKPDPENLESIASSKTVASESNFIPLIEENDYSEFSEEQKITEECLNIAIPIFKFFIFFPGKIIRLFFQIGDFYYLIQICSITFEYITILLVSGSEMNIALRIIYTILTILFSCLFGNVLAIPMWELFQLRWIKNKNPFQTIFNIFDINNYYNNYYNKTLIYIDDITNFICSTFFYVYIFCLIDYIYSTGESVDRMNSVFLLFVPAIKFLLIYASYIFKEIIIFFDIQIGKKKDDQIGLNEEESSNCISDDPFVTAMITKEDLKSQEKENENEQKDDQKRFKNLPNKNLVFFILKGLLIIIEFCFLIYFIAHYKIGIGGLLFSILVFAYVSSFSLFLSMPIWIFNLFNLWDCLHIIESKKGTNLSIRMNRNFKGFKYICLICQCLPFLIALFLFIFFCVGIYKKGTYFSRIVDEVKWDGQISGKYPYIPSITTVKSAMCYSKIHGLNLIQIASIAAAPYYDDLNNFKKFIYNSFFRDSNYVIDLNFIRQEDNHAVLLRADIDDVETGKNITIFSIRGSQTSNDWWLDIEIFVASAMLTVAKWIPFLQKHEGFTVKVVTGFMTLPLNLMVKSTLTYRYTSEMFDPINNFLTKTENVNRTVLFTGHSLGGGLSKVLASKYEIQSIAVSGPGITPVENNFRNSTNYDRYFKSKLIDIVPDRDLVPRFEISGGTRHRVLCKKFFGECHNKLRTICQMGISCNDEYHVGDFCSHAFSKSDYDQMKKLANI